MDPGVIETSSKYSNRIGVCLLTAHSLTVTGGLGWRFCGLGGSRLIDALDHES